MKKMLIVAISLSILGCPAAERRVDSPPAVATASDVSTTPVETTTAAAAPLAITSPADGAQVSISELVRGTTPHDRKKHYLVVTPEQTPLERWGQNGPAVLTNGTFSGTAQFGEGTAGLNETFHVRVLVTASTLPAGKLGDAAIPPDAIFSEPVSFKRTR